MAEQIAYRGPDAHYYWQDASQGIGFGHRRLSIIDLSPAGQQPMSSHSGRYVVVYNGEIYNYLDIRNELQSTGRAPLWHGHSDTEVMLAAVEAWGLEKTLGKLVGMFAIALWDRQTHTLSLARDRLGEKPLYYGWQGNVLLFGSELKALKAHPEFRAPINRDALTLYLRHSAVPSPYSIYENIHKLPPGSYLHITADSRQVQPVQYWSARQIAEQGQRDLFAGNEREAQQELQRLLSQAVRGQMMAADVPLGAFLSGGIDSSTVVALMQSQSQRPVRTFSIGFHEDGYDEAQHARAVAKHLGTDHTEHYVSSQDALNVIAKLPHIYDEPFADASQIPTYLVSQMARQHVTVSLSGDAGDELFGGYSRYFWAQNIWKKIGWAPQALRTLAGGMIGQVSPERWDRLLAGLLPKRYAYARVGDKLHKVAGMLAAHAPDDVYLSLVSHWQSPQDLVLGATEPITVISSKTDRIALDDFEHRMMYLDMATYLHDDILTKVDRAAMSVSLETRVPMLDHRVVEFAWQLPLSMKIREGQGKWLLRQVLYDHVPRTLIDRPKMGFGVPIDAWLRGPLKDWAANLLDPMQLRQQGLLRSEPIQQKWREHQSGTRNWAYALWNVLMFQAWLHEQNQG